MQPSSHHPSGSPRAVLRAAAAALAATVLLGAAGAGAARASARDARAAGQPAAAHPSQASHKGWVKYFIVDPPNNGAKEFLFEIAADTLGQGSRASEIFALNKGRLQPGGGRLENPTVIEPGWILILPSDARGAGVRFGPLPVVIPVPSPSPLPSAPARPAPVRHRKAVTPAARPDRRVIEAGIGAALVATLLLTGGLLLKRRRRSGSRPRRPEPARRPSRRDNRQARPADRSLPPQAAVLARDLAPPAAGAPAAGAPVGTARPAQPGPLDPPSYPSWLATPALDGVAPDAPHFPAMTVIPVSDGPAPARPAPSRPDDAAASGEAAWPDFLNPSDSPAVDQGEAAPADPAADQREAAPADPAADQREAAPPDPGADQGHAAPADPAAQPGPPVARIAPDVAGAPADVPAWLAEDIGAPAAGPFPAEHEPEPHQPETDQPATSRPETDQPETSQPGAHQPEAAFSPVALRLLGAQRSAAQRAGDAAVPVQRYSVGSGADRVQIVLAEAPAASPDGRPRSGRSLLTAAPYLAWTALPYEAPDGGTAFACLGIGDEGCLFLDLAAAPGAVAIGGDRDAATRLAESIVHQLSMALPSDQPRVVAVVGGVIPEPHPGSALSLASLGDLAAVSGTGASDAIEIVFSELRSDEDAFALARYVASSQRHVVPVVLADLPDAPWSFTAEPSLQPSSALHPASA
jgi:hypothetical protein